MKQKIVGTYEFGYEQIQLVIREGTGGEFFTCPEKGSLPRIKIGAYSKSEWAMVVCSLMHEVVEWSMFRQDCRFSPDNRTGIKSHADYLFVMSHEKFHDVISKSSEFLTNCMPDLSAAWKEWHEPKPKARGKKK